MQGAALVKSKPKLQCDKQMTQAGKQAGTNNNQLREGEKKKGVSLGSTVTDRAQAAALSIAP